MRAILTALLLLAPAPPALAQAGGKPIPPIARVQSEVNMFIELHNYLMVAATGAEDSLPEYRTEVKAYRDAREMAKDHKVWQIVNDACIAGPDLAAIAKAADGPAASALAPADHEALRKVVDALKSAWPRFEASDAVERHRSLQSVWTRVLLRHWHLVEDRLLTALYDKFEFKTIDAKITVYPVLQATEIGVWGKTAKGYYLVLPVEKLPNLVILEQVLHEVTHVLDLNQPAGSRSFLARLRQQAAGADKDELEAFTHGLIGWTAGEFIRRFVSADYKPLLDLSPDLGAPIRKYLPTYQGPWIAWIEGKLPADDAIKGMAAALKPAAAPPKG